MRKPFAERPRTPRDPKPADRPVAGFIRRPKTAAASSARAVRTMLLALGACVALASPSAAVEIERTFTISEAQMTQKFNSLAMVFTKVWVDIRSEPKVFNGRTYSGFISIHAEDHKDRRCRWDTAFDEVLKDFDPPFEPIKVAPTVGECEWSDWAYIDKAVGDWVTTEVQPHFYGFDGMPIMSNIAAKGHYFPDKLVLVLRLRTVKMQDQFDKQIDRKLLLDPKLLTK